jgi:hypothetical protein
MCSTAADRRSGALLESADGPHRTTRPNIRLTRLDGAPERHLVVVELVAVDVNPSTAGVSRRLLVCGTCLELVQRADTGPTGCSNSAGDGDIRRRSLSRPHLR